MLTLEQDLTNKALAEGTIKGILAGKLEGKLEGMREGKLEGMREGKLEGEVEGKRKTFSNLARAKFGGLPPARAVQVAGASSDQLDRWLVALLRAGNLDDVFDAAGPD